MDVQKRESERFFREFKTRRMFGRGGIVLAVTLLVLFWIYTTPDGILGIPDAIGNAVCHRISLRSFFVYDVQFPLCARCTGMYLGAMASLIFQYIQGRRKGGMPPRRVVMVLAILALIWLVDGVNSYLHLFPNAPGIYEPNNTLRILTGSGVGLVAATLLYPAFQETVWKDWTPEPAIGNVRTLGAMLGLVLIVDGLVLLQNPVILYPAAFLSAAGVMVLLSIVYTMLLIMILKLENRFLRWIDVILPLVTGLGISVLQILLMDHLRSLLGLVVPGL